MRENLFSLRVSVRSFQNACVSRKMRETWKVCRYCWNFICNILRQTDHCNNYCICRSQVNSSYLSALWVSAIKNWILYHLSNDFLMIIRDHDGWSLTANRKERKMSGFWPKKIAVASEIRVLITYERVFESDRYKTQVTGHCFTNTESI